MSPSTGKALLASALFTGIGVWGWFTTAPGNAEAIPLGIYFAVLIVNTFFSIRLFAAITPKNSAQTLFDAALVGMYGALAFSFGSVTLFCSVLSAFFPLSIAKYVHLNRLITQPRLLPRKIRINILGCLLSLVALGIALIGLAPVAAWMLAGIFTIANVYLLFINPMYRPSDPGSRRED